MAPPDIRAFFGKGAASTPAKEAKKDDESTTKKRRGGRMVVSDSEDDDPQPKKATPKKLPAKKAVKESPKGQETTTDDYFASSNKPKKSNATSIKKEAKSESSTPQKATPKAKKEMASKPATKRRKKETVSYKEEDSDALVLDDEGAGGDDIFADDMKMNGRRKDDGYIEVESDDEVLPKPKATRGKKAAVNLESDDEDVVMVDAPSKRGASTAGKKRKSISVDLDEDSEDDDAPPKKGAKKNSAAKKPAPKKPRAPAKKKEPEPESAAMQAIFDSIPLVRPPTPPPQDPDAKFDWRTAAAAGGNTGPPPEADDKDWDIGAENCLAGMTFVFTGLLQSISRDRGTEIVKKYGGKVTTAPSKKTSFVVLGNDAGPSKLRKIAELSIKTIDENGLYALISRVPASGGDGKAAEKVTEKKKAEEAKLKADAKKQEEEDRKRREEAEKEVRRKAEIRGLAPPTTPRDSTADQLWTTKYAPTSVAQICGNKGQVEKIQNWLRKWPKSHRVGFSMGGEDGTGKYRAIIIHGPPGIGKTTAAHLAAKLAGYDVIESNASDTRSKKLVENGLGDVLNNTSLLGYFAADGDNVESKKKNIVLIMDEVDGMSAGDRGGVGALAKICKTTQIPMILICNDRKLQKMKPFDFVTFDMPFRRPTVDMVRSRIATICHREKLKLPMPVIEALIEGSNKDIRQIINMISQIKLDEETMDLQQSKGMSKAWEKHVVLKPWDICHKILGSGMFSSTSSSSLNDKIELYFNDHEFSYLMVQENYLKCKPILANGKGYTEKEYKLKVLELADKAAESISDGDLVDRMIHGSQQQWSLMPTHAVFSTVRPASFMSGAMAGGTEFTKWLGNNSKAGKLTRYVKEIQSHMRIKTSADRHDIRQSYLPVMWTKTIGRMQADGKDAVDEVIDLMDSYYLTREDLDFITELGLDYQSEENAKLETQTKATLTRLYNQRSHPVPFMKAGNLGGAMKAAPKVAPDLEEAIEEEDDEVAVVDPADDDDESVDLKKDKYIKQPKQKKTAGAGKNKAAGKATKKSKKAGDDDADDLLDDEEEEEDVKPKKKAAKPRAKAAPKGKPKK